MTLTISEIDRGRRSKITMKQTIIRYKVQFMTIFAIELECLPWRRYVLFECV